MSANENSHQNNAERNATAASVNCCGEGIKNSEDFNRVVAQSTREAIVMSSFEDIGDTLFPKKETLLTINYHQESIEKLDSEAETFRRLNGHLGFEKRSEYLVCEKLYSKTATSARIKCGEDGAKLSGCECYKKELNFQDDGCERSSSGLSQIKTKWNPFSSAADNAKKTGETKNSDYDICKKVLHVSQCHISQKLNIHHDSSVRGEDHAYLEKELSLGIKKPVNVELLPNIGHLLNNIERNTNLQHIPVGKTSLMHEHNLELRISSDIGHQITFENI